MAERLQGFCIFFLGCKYGPWVDGKNLESLDDFNYQFDLLDCVTYVEVVLALAKTYPDNDMQKFEQSLVNSLRNIHYANGETKFIARNHFMSIDWIQNNRQLVEDITNFLFTGTKLSITLIDKLSWVKQHAVNQGQEILAHLTAKLQPQLSQLPYIFSEDLLANKEHFYQVFPECSIVNIVRPNWDLTEKIGTHLDTSHLGFAFKEPSASTLLFYHASSVPMAAVKANLFDYMQSQLSNSTIAGINVLGITPGFYNAR